MRHGKPTTDVHHSGISFAEFYAYLIKTIDPGLDQDYDLSNEIPPVEVILHSQAQRCRETAELIKNRVSNKLAYFGEIDNLVNEIEFSGSILSHDEFYSKKRRELILKRWFYGENMESLTNSIQRIRRLLFLLQRSHYNRIMIVTHGIYMGLFQLYLERKEINLESLFQLERFGYGQIICKHLQ